MLRVAVLDDYQRVAAGAADWSVLDDRTELVFFHDHVDGDDLVARLEGFDAAVLMRERSRLPGPLLQRLPRLRLITTSGSANAALDVAAAARLGITVCGTKSWAGVTATIEHTWGLILALVRNIPQEDRAIREGGWMVGLGPSLQGKTLGIVGLGNLGSLMPPVARAFGMRVVAWSRNLDGERARTAGVERLDHDAFFSVADVVSVHVKLSDTSRGYVGRHQLGLMKPTAYLVNTSRGPVVDTAALLDALDGGRIAGAALDVFDDEPLPAGHPLRRQARTVLTPHMGYATVDSYREYFEQIVEDIDAFLRGSPIRLLTDG
jgi:phosphoglycerate dehydrogenase-like enzyme